MSMTRMSGLGLALHRDVRRRAVRGLAADGREPPALRGQRQERAVAVVELGLAVGQVQVEPCDGAGLDLQAGDRLAARLLFVVLERLSRVGGERTARGGAVAR